jgi:hypothetical protein
VPTGGAASFVITPFASQNTASGDNRRCQWTAVMVQVPGAGLHAQFSVTLAGVVCRACGVPP